MHNTLLIHNNNVPALLTFSHRIKFNIHDSNIDEYITNEIIPEIKNKEFDYICIKDTLSSSYLELYGLRLAYHIRLSVELGGKRFVPILILSDLDSFLLNKLAPSANILFTKNVFVVKNNIDAIESVITNKILPITEPEYEKDFLNRIHVNAPKDYLTHHSITNEWAMYQWSHLLDVSSAAISKNTQKITAMLYFKYLIAKYNLETKSKNKIKQTKKSGSVLLIDDKWNEGWKDVIDSFLNQQYSDVKLDVLEYNFKDKSIEDIKTSLEEKMDVSRPDVVLLDLRLLESDDTLKINKKKSINKLSGIQIIGEIQKVNPGIQIIMFTASGDSLILDELHNKGILGYVKKDAPTDKYETSKNSFKKLDTLIKKGIDKNYLKTVWSLQEKILSLPFLTNNSDPTIYELRNSIKSVFDVLNSNMPNAFVYAMLAIFRCLEILVSIYIYEEKKDKKRFAYWKITDSKIDYFKWNDYSPQPTINQNNDSTSNKIRILIYEKFNLRDNEIHDIILDLADKRNDEIHQKSPEIYQKDIIKWFEILFHILDSIKKNS